MMKSRCILFSMLAGLSSMLTFDLVNPQPNYAKSLSSQCVTNHVDNSKSGISQTFQVDKKRVKIRTAPNIDSGVVKTLHPGETIQGINESGWIKMIDGNYACAQYLNPIDPTPIHPTPIAATQASPIISPPQQLSTAPVDPPASTVITNQPDPTPEFPINSQILIGFLMSGSFLMVIVIAYNSGHFKGHTQGNEHGYDKGYSDGYQKGNNDGYEKGHSDGYYKGTNDGYDEASGEHTVEIIPVYYATNNKFLFFGSYCIKQGYFYQTYIKGMPSVKSEFILVETTEVNEIDQEKLLELTKGVVEIAARLHPLLAFSQLPQKIMEAQSK